MPNAKNVATMEALKADLQDVTAVWAISYNALTVKDAEALRRAIRAAGGVMKVYKNTLMRRGLAELELPAMDEVLEGPSAFIFTAGDPVAAIKAAKDFAKANPAIAIKGGIMDGQFQNAAAAEAIASLPSKDQLLGQIAASLTGVASQLAIAIGEMSEKEAA